MMYDIRCNAGGARPIKVRLGEGTIPRGEHLALALMSITQSKQR